ncbi:16198_t:CDS:2, partial [Funneliformis caledonium]
EPEICSLYNEADLLFESNGAILEADMICSRCRQSIYLEDDNTQLLLQEEEYIIEKLFKDLAKEPQDFSPLSENSVEETENPTTSEMIFVELHNKIV